MNNEDPEFEKWFFVQYGACPSGVDPALMRDRIKAARTMLENDEKALAEIEAWTLKRRVARKAWDQGKR